MHYNIPFLYDAPKREEAGEFEIGFGAIATIDITRLFADWATMVRHRLPLGLSIVSIIGLCILWMNNGINGDMDFHHRSILSADASNQKLVTII